MTFIPKMICCFAGHWWFYMHRNVNRNVFNDRKNVNVIALYTWGFTQQADMETACWGLCPTTAGHDGCTMWWWWLRRWWWWWWWWWIEQFLYAYKYIFNQTNMPTRVLGVLALGWLEYNDVMWQTKTAGISHANQLAIEIHKIKDN